MTDNPARAEEGHPALADFKAVVVAAGSSSRFGGELPKQFHQLSGRSVLEISVALLAERPAVAGVIVVLSPDRVNSSAGLAVRDWPGVLDVVAGGESRCESVTRGIEAATGSKFVLVHDAARPFASAALVDSVIDSTRRFGAAVPLLPIHDTVKRVEHRSIAETLPREALGLAQTPQGARTDWLRAALKSARESGQSFTDEAAALEREGYAVAAVPGDPANRKITTAADLEELRGRAGDWDPGFRVGTGFDIHRVSASRPLILGGVRFEGQPGLEGHSDADVVLHAAMDALLGAAGLGDIGTYFPPEDPAFAGADSADLGRKVAGEIRSRGFEVVNVDLMLLAEAPRVREHVPAMREAIAASLGVSVDRIGLKATTLERLGSLGRREGIACQATALLARRPAV